MGAGDLTEPPVAVDVVFERFPASIRGAVLLRGTDADPHQVTVEEARVVEAGHPPRGSRPIAFEPVTVDIAPHGEVVVPFDVPFAALTPGWYRVSAVGVVDGGRRVAGPAEESPFLVPWPSEDVRRSDLRVDRELRIPRGPTAVVERVECKSDRAIVRWRAPRATESLELRVLADRRRLPVLEARGEGDERITVVYPLLKRHRSLGLELERRGGGRATATIDLR